MRPAALPFLSPYHRSIFQQDNVQPQTTISRHVTVSETRQFNSTIGESFARYPIGGYTSTLRVNSKSLLGQNFNVLLPDKAR